MMIHVDAIPAFSDNYIWCLYDSQSRQAVVVDPGDAAPVQAALKEKGLSLSAILITHHHLDHTGGIDALIADNPVPVYGPANQNIAQITEPLGENDSLTLLGLTFSVLKIPGHTLDHIAFYCEQHSDSQQLGLSSLPGAPLLFCGDTLFAGGCGRVFEGNPTMMLDSLNKLAALAANTKVYCAHEYTLGNLAFASAVEPANALLQQRIERDSQLRHEGKPTVPSTIAIELQTNPFLRCTESSVISSAEQHRGTHCSNPQEVFATVRAWKDSF